uniref:Myb-like domain-containing protein n=1 Tax=Oryza nivara TaxID=4536 RepID=A0A0E0GMT8_ORYNI
MEKKIDVIAMELQGLEQEAAVQPPASAAFPSSAEEAAAAASPTSGGKRIVLRIRLPPAWTPEEDACLARLAAENGFRHWRRVAESMAAARSGRRPRRSPGQCRDRWRDHLARDCRDRWRDHLARDVYHRPFTADDDAELARLLLKRDGDGERSWKDISRAAYCRTSRGMRRRWGELRDSDAFLRKLWCPPPPPMQPSC